MAETSICWNRKGWFRWPRGTDHRGRPVHLTDQGAAALEAAAPLWEQAQAAVDEALGKEQLETLTALLAKVAAVAP